MLKITNVAKRKRQRKSERTILVCREREEKGGTPERFSGERLSARLKMFSLSCVFAVNFNLCFRRNKKDRFIQSVFQFGLFSLVVACACLRSREATTHLFKTSTRRGAISF